MNLSSRSALALLLGTALAGSLSSCDYSWSPGKNPQSVYNFNNPPGWRNVDVNRDSINYKQVTPPPGGEGSAADIRQGTVRDQINSAPGGRSSASTQSASGQLAPIDDSRNGAGNDNDQQQPKTQPR
ncbi:hypothetical protein [Hymenobacter arizonensis]|uniref:Uncharacterized protein n=1 Tax=Hymenobacter arizonensis TaxID=1227077 RepID=A0A1I6ASC6_HYMAR|nr:hypothetical protein [Hymenobacter arizonensis]SFQ71611.1 hypothetical protein SAMN04515668_3847 [Hymenobacter arizonensis]